MVAKGDKDKFKKLLERNFPKIHEGLESSKFYDKFRNPMVHNFTTTKGFGIAHDYELHSKYVEKSHKLTCINIDRFAEDFVKWIYRSTKLNK